MLVNLSAPRASKRNIPRGVRTRRGARHGLVDRGEADARIRSGRRGALVLAWLLALTRTHPGRAGAEESLTLVVLLPAARSQSSRPLLATPPGVAPTAARSGAVHRDSTTGVPSAGAGDWAGRD